MTGTLLAIDPGPFESAYITINTDSRKPIDFGKVLNRDLRVIIDHGIIFHDAVIEMVASYGMAVGAEVFETVLWAGRFTEQITLQTGHEPTLIKRNPIKVHHCHSSQARDSNIRQALVDRFAYGQPNHGKGTNKAPGWFHGFHSDIWAAYALAVYAADTAKVAA